MGRLEEVAERDEWRCWICDEPVDPQMSVNDQRGPSVDQVLTKAQNKKAQSKAKGPAEERLAHRGCNTRKGAVAPVAPWPAHLFIADPAPIIDTVDALRRKGGRSVVGRSPSRADADAVAAWLADRVSRLARDLDLRVMVEPGGGQFMVVLQA